MPLASHKRPTDDGRANFAIRNALIASRVRRAVAGVVTVGTSLVPAAHAQFVQSNALVSTSATASNYSAWGSISSPVSGVTMVTDGKDFASGGNAGANYRRIWVGLGTQNGGSGIVTAANRLQYLYIRMDLASTGLYESSNFNIQLNLGGAPDGRVDHLLTLRPYAVGNHARPAQGDIRVQLQRYSNSCGPCGGVYPLLGAFTTGAFSSVDYDNLSDTASTAAVGYVGTATDGRNGFEVRIPVSLLGGDASRLVKDDGTGADAMSPAIFSSGGSFGAVATVLDYLADASGNNVSLVINTLAGGVTAVTGTKLAYVAQPIAANAGATLGAFSVAVENADGTATSATSNVTISVASGPGAISGTTTKAAVSGTATFNDISFSTPGTYTLTASATGLLSTTSNSFVISATVASAPTITAVTPSSGQLSVAFTAPTSDGGAAITNYQYSTNGGTSWTSASPAQTTSPLVITGLTNGTTYTTALRAVNAVGAGATSNTVSGTPSTVPGAPTITGVTAGDAQLSVAFTAGSTGGSALTNYEYSSDNGATWTAVSPASVTSPIGITGLTNGTTYTVRLRAVNGVGSGTASASATGTPVTVPGAPTITGVTAGNAQLSVAFTAGSTGGSPLTNYEYSSDNGATWTAVSPASVTSPIVITGLTNGTTYTVRIRAVNGVGSGTASTSATGTPATVPGAPTITGVTAGNAQLSVVFTAGSTGGSPLTNYEYSSDNGATWTAVSPASVTSPIVISGLTNGTTYTVRIRAVNGVGSGTASASATGTPVTVPGAPTITGVTSGNGQLSVAFTAGSTGGSPLTNYEYSSDNGTTWTAVSPASVTSPIIITGLTNGTTYTVAVRAVNTVGSGTASASATGTPATVPGAPMITGVTAGNGQLSVAFAAGTTGGSALTNYEYSSDNGGTWTAVSPASTASPVVMTGLTNGTTYTVRLRAVNGVGSGTASTSATGTPVAPATIPGAPTITGVTAGNAQLSVAFTAGSTGGSALTNYEYSSDNGATWTAVSPAAVTSPIIITGLTNGTTYTVAVRAVNGVGSGTASASATGTPATVPGAPTITGVTAGNGQLSVSFAAGTTGGSALTNYEYSSDNGATWTPVSPASVTSPIVITGLTNGITYTVRLRAVNGVGSGTASTSATGTPVAPATIPGAPTITGVTAGNAQLSVAFTAGTTGGSALTNYEYSSDNGATWTAVSPAAVTSPIVISGLTNGTAYTVRIRAVNGVGTGTASVAATSTPVAPATVPGAPTIIGVTAGNAQLSVAFTAGSTGGSALTNYEYSSDNGITWTPVSPASTGSPVVITGLTNGTTYTVRLRAVNGVGSGTASASATGTPVAPATVPGAPTITGVTAGNAQLSVAFTAGTTGGSALTNYEYSSDNGGTWTAVSPASTGSPVVITGLMNGTTYTVAVRAVNGVGSGTASATANGTPVAPATVPGAPTITGVTAGDAQLSVAFTAGTTGGSALTNYEYSSDNGATWTAMSPASVTSPIVISGLTNGTTYTVRLRAVNGVGTGTASASATGTPATIPGAPTITGVTAGNAQLSVAFTAGSTGGSALTNYEYSSDNGATWTAVSPTSVTSPIVISGLTNGTAYTVRIRAVNGVGTGTASVAATSTPVAPATAPGAPTIAGVTAGNGQLSVAFTAGATGGSALTNYEYSSDNGATWTPVSPASVTSPIVITGLTNGTTYTVRLRAVNGVGSGTASASATGTPVAPATVPGAPTITGVTAGDAQLSVAFTAGTTGGSALTNYEYSSDNGATWTAVSPASTGSPVVIAGLTNGTAYTVAVRAVNGVGSGTASTSATGTPIAPATAPGAPTITGVTAGNGQLSVAFTAGTTGGSALTNYEYSSDNGATWTAVSPASTGSPVVITGLTNGTAYTVTVRAVNGVGSGTASASATGTPVAPATVPGAPTITGVTASNAQLSVAFTAGATGGSALTNYEYSSDNGATWTAVSPASVTSPIVITSLTNGTAYTVAVRAVNGVGSGTASASATGTPATVPSAPTITGVTAGNGQLSVAFTAGATGGSALTNYEYSSDNGATWTAVSPASVTSPIVISGLANGTTYTVAVRAVNGVGSGTASTNATGTPVAPTTIPGAPTITGVAAGNGQLAVAFTAGSTGGSALTNYEYSSDNGGTWTPVSPASVTSPIVISGLTNGTTYTVRLRAVNGVGTGTASASAMGTPVAPATVPGAPTITGVTAGNAQLSVAFTAGSTGGSALTNYEYSSDNGATWTAVSPASTASPVVMTGLTNGTTYTVRLRAVNGVGTGTASTSTTGAPVAPATVPGAPTITGVTAGNAQLSVAFTAGSTGGSALTNYEYSSDNGATWTAVSPVSTASPVVMMGLTNGTTYTVRLRAVNGVGSGTASTSATGTPVAPATIPGAPTITGVTAGNGQLSVAFTAGGNGGSALTNYEYSSDNGTTWTAMSPASVTSPVVITGLTNGTAYTVRIRAVNGVGSGTASTSATGTPVAPATIPGAPTITGVTAGNAQLSVAFTAGSTGGSALTNYEYSSDNGATWTAVSPAAVTSPIVISGLTNGTTYTVRLRAVNGVGSGTASTSATGTPVAPATVPGAPTITGVAAGNGQLSVAFTAGTTGGSALTNYEYSSDNGATWTAVSPAAVTSPIIITGLTNGTTYTVAVRAVNGVGSGTASASATGTPATVPGAPTITGVTAGNGQLSVSFAAGTTGGSALTNYEYSSDNGATWTPVSPASVTSPIVITGLTNGITYTVRLRAVNGVGNGTASASATGTPVAPATVPGAPTITGVTAGNAQLSVAFTAGTTGGSALTNYEYSSDNGATWTAVSPAAVTSPIVISGLTNGTAYTVRIRAVNGVGTGTASVAATSTPVAPATVPGAPTIIGVTAGNAQLSVAFTAGSTGGSALTNYEYSSDNGITWTPVSPASTGSPVVITGLTNGTTYTVRLRAVNGVGSGTASASATGTPVAPATIPGAPTITGVTAGNAQLSVAFTAGSTGGSALTNYEYSSDNGATWTAVSPASTASPVVMMGLTNGTTYTVRIRAVNGVGSGTASTSATGTPVAPATIPGAPTITGVTAGDAQLSVAFTAGTTGGSALTNYEYSSDNGATWTAMSPASVTSPIVIMGLTNGTTYTVRVRAVNGVGSGTASASATGTPATIPGAPTITGVTAGNGQLSVAFAAGTTGGSALTNYEYSSDNGGTWTAVSPASTVSPVVMTGLTNGTAYTVRLRAVNGAGTGAASASLVSTPAPTVTAPTSTAPPTISGTPRTGQSLAITPGVWSATPAPTLTYQWQHCDAVGANCANIIAATATAYTVATADTGATIRVIETATNAAGAMTSASVQVAVVTMLPVASAPPSITGTATQGQTLSALTGTWVGSPSPALTYQWKRCDTTGANCVAIPSATTATYLLTLADVAATLRVDVTANNAAGTTTTSSAPTGSIGALGTAPSNSVAPLITGTATVGQTLTRVTGTWSGAPAPALSYQWQRCDASGANCVAITGATTTTYVLDATDASSTIRVVETGINASGTTTSTSAPTTAVAMTPATTQPPTIIGTPMFGQTLTLNPGTWTGAPAPSYAYEWLRCDVNGTGCVSIPGATSASYAITAPDVGSTIRLRLTGTNTAGSATVTTGASGAVVAAPAAPVTSTPPTIGGTASVGQVLSVVPGTWSGTPAPSLRYEWQRCDAAGANCMTIAGAVGTTYTLTAADAGATIRVAELATNASGTATSVASQTVGVTATVANTTAPTIEGASIVGQTLTGLPGTWTGAPAPTFTYQWQRCDAGQANCANIPSATMSKYTLGSADSARTMRLVVTAANSYGSANASSSATESVSAAPAAPSNSGVPRITGSAVVGQLLTASPGIWTGNPVPALTYQWQRCAPSGAVCVDVPGATTATYVLDSADVQASMQVRVTSTNASGSASALSAATAVIRGLPVPLPANLVAPSISGTSQVGELLTVNPGSWSNASSLTNQWQRCDPDGTNCVTVAGATGATYALTSADAGKQIRVVVNGTNGTGTTSATGSAGPIGPAIASATTSTVLALGTVATDVLPRGASAPDSVPADGSRFAVVRITLRDALGNPITGRRGDEFTTTIDGVAVTTTVRETPTAGMYEFEVRSNKVNTAKLSVSIDGRALNGRPTVAFVIAAADLDIHIVSSSATPRVGQTIVFTIDVKNLGPNDATGVEVEHKLADRVRFVASAATHGRYDPITASWSIGSLALGETATLTVTVTVIK